MAAITSSTGHSRKRPYQPSITSYFNTRNADPDVSSRLQKSTSPLSPPLPEDTQASLLNVGMRVRKSVPEGYKTHKTLGTHGFPFPSSAPSASMPSVQSSGAGVDARELTPFCGLHKTGGWAAQELLPSSAPAVVERDEDRLEMPVMTMSQSSLPSTQTSSMSSRSTRSEPVRKRTYEDEIEYDMDAIFDNVEAADLAAQQMPPSSRPIARMKPTVQKPRLDRLVRIAGDDDFEEAAFLAAEDGMEVDGA